MKRGLTLIEVILAVTILSLGLSVLLSTAAKCLAVLKMARLYQEAHWVRGMGDLEHPVAEADKPEDIAVDREPFPNGMEYAREVDDDEDEDGLYVVRTRVTWAENEREGSDELVAYVWRPEKD
jgi:prepilin-type N-terminal cleavage/methylation domain-containing protein